MPKDIPALMMPEKVATRMPFLKLNSAIVFFFCSSGISRSLVNPASAAMQMPRRHTATPASVICPGRVEAICPMDSGTGIFGRKILKMGGSSVPKAVQ